MTHRISQFVAVCQDRYAKNYPKELGGHPPGIAGTTIVSQTWCEDQAAKAQQQEKSPGQFGEDASTVAIYSIPCLWPVSQRESR